MRPRRQRNKGKSTRAAHQSQSKKTPPGSHRCVIPAVFSFVLYETTSQDMVKTIFPITRRPVISPKAVR